MALFLLIVTAFDDVLLCIGAVCGMPAELHVCRLSGSAKAWHAIAAEGQQ